MTEVSEGAIVRPEDVPSEPVDLVIYLEGERIVVGKAGVNPDGTFAAEMYPEQDSRVSKILGHVQGEFCFGLPRRMKPLHQPAFTAGDLPFDGELPQ